MAIGAKIEAGKAGFKDLEQKYDAQFKVVFDAIRQLMAPPPAPPKPEIGFHVKEDAVPYRTRKRC